jgi:hypothetical protein
MPEPNTPTNETTVYCKFCKIKRTDGIFYWSNASPDSRVAPPDAVYTKICKYAISTGKVTPISPCLNPEGGQDDQYNRNSIDF